MEFNPSPPPLVDDAHIGDLYVDQATKSIWLIVDESVDPSRAILLCEIDAIIDAVETAEQDANTYTNAQVALKAPLVHAHTASQITDFDDAVQDAIGTIPGVSFAPGMIVMWSGLLSEIGVGPLAGWALCDGSNGTPNLRDKFIIGAGNRAPGTLNSLASMDTTSAGAHTHTVAGTALTMAQMPAHDHGGATLGDSVDHSHFVSGNTGTESANHTHTTPLFGGSNATLNDTAGIASNSSFRGGAASSIQSNTHTHPIGIWSSGISTSHVHAIVINGSSQSHTHGLSSDGTHAHSISSATLRETIPYYALAFIMKL